MLRLAALAVPFLALALIGCTPSQADIEKSIKNEMKTGLGVDITVISLTKQADGGYTGTATAANGDVYDVVAQAPKGGRTEWKATPAQSSVEKMIRTGLEEQLKVKVKSLDLTKKGPGVFEGTADLEGGRKMKVSTTLEGTQVKWSAEPLFK